jgi:hypothetical protein
MQFLSASGSVLSCVFAKNASPRSPVRFFQEVQLRIPAGGNYIRTSHTRPRANYFNNHGSHTRPRVDYFNNHGGLPRLLANMWILLKFDSTRSDLMHCLASNLDRSRWQIEDNAGLRILEAPRREKEQENGMPLLHLGTSNSIALKSAEVQTVSKSKSSHY